MPSDWQVSEADRWYKYTHGRELTYYITGFDFDFQAIASEFSPWVRTYESINAGMFQTLYMLFPFLERHFLWLLPNRRRQHQDLTELLGLMQSMVEKKKADFAEGAKSNVKDNEKDLLTLMIEQSEDEGGILSNDELMVGLQSILRRSSYCFLDILIVSYRVICAYFSWPGMTRPRAR